VRFGTLDQATATALTRAAHDRGLLVIAHVGSPDDVDVAIEAGVDGLAHLPTAGLDDARVARIAAARMFVVPTLSVLESICGNDDRASLALARHPAIAPYLAPQEAENLARLFPARDRSRFDCARPRDTVRRLRDAGVPLLAGTDVPNPATAHGVTIHGELALLVKSGLTPVEALAAATANAARAFRLEDRGRIAPGATGGVVLVDGDPTGDVTATAEIEAVWYAGRRAERPKQ
jgi:imidazolonepropionase-like amidohydrolase